jgi:hypothetical protein
MHRTLLVAAVVVWVCTLGGGFFNAATKTDKPGEAVAVTLLSIALHALEMYVIVQAWNP